MNETFKVVLLVFFLLPIYNMNANQSTQKREKLVQEREKFKGTRKGKIIISYSVQKESYILSSAVMQCLTLYRLFLLQSLITDRQFVCKARLQNTRRRGSDWCHVHQLILSLKIQRISYYTRMIEVVLSWCMFAIISTGLLTAIWCHLTWSLIYCHTYTHPKF
jgi:hypothetical protein